METSRGIAAPKVGQALDRAADRRDGGRALDVGMALASERGECRMPSLVFALSHAGDTLDGRVYRASGKPGDRRPSV